VRIGVQADVALTIPEPPAPLPEIPSPKRAAPKSDARPRARVADTAPEIPSPKPELSSPKEAEPASDARPPARVMRTAPERLTEALARREEILAAPDAESASEIALSIVMDLVEAESGAVLQRLYETRTLSFVAAAGPRAGRVLGTTFAGTTGIAGFAFTSGVGLIVQDAGADGHFAPSVDDASGYHTRSVLAMPVRMTAGPIYGCLELLNAPDCFHAEDLEIVRVLALALGRRLRMAAE
jgi:hypothetical protein